MNMIKNNDNNNSSSSTITTNNDNHDNTHSFITLLLRMTIILIMVITIMLIILPPKERLKVLYGRGASDGRLETTVGFHNFNLRIFNLRVSNPNRLIVDVCLTRCRISMCQGLGTKKHDEISEIDRRLAPNTLTYI